MEEKAKLIESLIKLLGTMVMFPIEKTNPDTFTKEVIGNVQRPILEGEDREVVKEVLLGIVTSIKETKYTR